LKVMPPNGKKEVKLRWTEEVYTNEGKKKVKVILSLRREEKRVGPLLPGEPSFLSGGSKGQGGRKKKNGH